MPSDGASLGPRWSACGVGPSACGAGPPGAGGAEPNASGMRPAGADGGLGVDVLSLLCLVACVISRVSSCICAIICACRLFRSSSCCFIRASCRSSCSRICSHHPSGISPVSREGVIEACGVAAGRVGSVASGGNRTGPFCDGLSLVGEADEFIVMCGGDGPPCSRWWV